MFVRGGRNDNQQSLGTIVATISTVITMLSLVREGLRRAAEVRHLRRSCLAALGLLWEGGLGGGGGGGSGLGGVGVWG